MAIYDYKRYKISLHTDSRKTQGLQVGDIVRRQYSDAVSGTISTFMCVLDSGVDRVKNEESGLYEDSPYFIGALFPDSNAPKSGELLDFARITNLFNVDRSGALYLTSSDSESPYMDVIDGIGKNESLSWPVGIASQDYEDSTCQYVVSHNDNLNLSYQDDNQDAHRILTVTRTAYNENGFEGLHQDFYQFVKAGECVVVSYKVRASKDMSVNMSLGYIDDTTLDGEWDEDVTTQWQYKFKIVTVSASGRHLRTLKMSMEELAVGDEMQIADFNIILLSSLVNFGDASKTRIGKLDGVVDNVFGNLEGYGAYLQKLYAANSAHISGTLTAGDANGFGATFYAGKIHKNCFSNSIDINFKSNIIIDNDSIINPTGVGNVYRSSSEMVLEAQDNKWLAENADKTYCFSFWLYAKKPCDITISQNGASIGVISIKAEETHEWRRLHKKVNLMLPESESEGLLFSLSPQFGESVYDSVSSEETNIDANEFYITAPQLEEGGEPTQYQPTDSVLDTTNDYGAWFSRGGIGGTMQNPLLKLNHDGKGSIATRTKSIEIKQDGSGYIANKNIQWNEKGDVEFGPGVTLKWENFDKDSQNIVASRYMKIVGEDTFTVVGQDSNLGSMYSPSVIKLSIDEVGFESTSSMRQWYYKDKGEFKPIEGANSSTFIVEPESDYWNNTSTLTIKCDMTLPNGQICSDTITIKKQYVQGYTVEIVSSKGTSFQNGRCNTVLTANVYYQGKLVTEEYVMSHFGLVWSRYDASTSSELPMRGLCDGNKLILDYEIDASEIFSCELFTADNFDYTFPIIF